MNRRSYGAIILGAAVCLGTWATVADARKKAEPMLAHMVYFSLNDPSEENVQAVIKSCHLHLKGHEGAVFYAAGPLAKDLNREVNQRDFDVALQLVFDSQEAHDTYQTHPRHLAFIEESGPKFKTVRVFDALVTAE